MTIGYDLRLLLAGQLAFNRLWLRCDKLQEISQSRLCSARQCAWPTGRDILGAVQRATRPGHLFLDILLRQPEAARPHSGFTIDGCGIPDFALVADFLNVQIDPKAALRRRYLQGG